MNDRYMRHPPCLGSKIIVHVAGDNVSNVDVASKREK